MLPAGSCCCWKTAEAVDFVLLPCLGGERATTTSAPGADTMEQKLPVPPLLESPQIDKHRGKQSVAFAFSVLCTKGASRCAPPKHSELRPGSPPSPFPSDTFSPTRKRLRRRRAKPPVMADSYFRKR